MGEELPIIEEDLCIGCGACVAACPYDVFEIEDEKVRIIHPDACHRTGDCAKVCPTDAISLPGQG